MEQLQVHSDEGCRGDQCIVFVNFKNLGDVAKDVDYINVYKFDDKEWYVGRALKKYEREVELRVRFKQLQKEQIEKFQGGNIYVKNVQLAFN